MCFRVVVLKCQVPALEENSFAEEKVQFYFLLLKAFFLFSFLLHYPK